MNPHPLIDILGYTSGYTFRNLDIQLVKQIALMLQCQGPMYGGYYSPVLLDYEPNNVEQITMMNLFCKLERLALCLIAMKTSYEIHNHFVVLYGS
ncbi:TPA: hypothetical protein JAZ56_03385 [Legionella pneumophila]|nr:hypothetical protein [Legionella pneumophila]